MTCPLRNISTSLVEGYILVSSSEEESTQFITIKHPTANTRPMYSIANRMRNTEIFLFQQCQTSVSRNGKTNVPPESVAEFAFDHPTHPRVVVVEFVDDEGGYMGQVVADVSNAQW